jgi:BASS family bile acid:Na+ symporter
MNTVFSLFITLTLFSTMLALGLNLRVDALKPWLSRPGLPLRVLLGSCVLVPLLALLLLQTPWSQTIAQPARYAIALMALCPSAPLTLRKARKAGGDHQLAGLLQVGAVLSAIVTIPLLGLAFRQSFAVLGWEIQPLDVALQVARVQVLPLLIGMGLRHWKAPIAERLEGPLDRIANGLLLLLVLLVLLKAGPLLLTYIPRNLPALALMALMAAASLALGGALAGAQSAHRRTTALVVSMRNPGLALLFANLHGANLPGLKLGVLVYVLVTVILTIPVMRANSTIQP